MTKTQKSLLNLNEEEQYEHIHTQLQKAAESEINPHEVRFLNGKKHTVSQEVAKHLLKTLDRLKPDDRGRMHNTIAQSYDHLLSVHKMVHG